MDARNTTFAAGPIAQAYPSASTTVPNGTFTKIPLNAVEYDTDSSIDTANGRFKPNKAGYYRISSSIAFPMTGPGGMTLSLHLAKNGGTIKTHAELINYNSSFNQTITINTIVHMNGTTDHLEIYATQNSGSSANVAGGSSSSWFSAEYLRN
ncbi:MAG: hypothetical protein KF789_07995 [Bdellovibrionaceae bacterium]|nr:hypothetical protein [Pseudobdellovibrionaceae bacterium]